MRCLKEVRRVELHLPERTRFLLEHSGQASRSLTSVQDTGCTPSVDHPIWLWLYRPQIAYPAAPLRWLLQRVSCSTLSGWLTLTLTAQQPKPTLAPSTLQPVPRCWWAHCPGGGAPESDRSAPPGPPAPGTASRVVTSSESIVHTTGFPRKMKTGSRHPLLSNLQPPTGPELQPPAFILPRTGPRSQLFSCTSAPLQDLHTAVFRLFFLSTWVSA